MLVASHRCCSCSVRVPHLQEGEGGGSRSWTLLNAERRWRTVTCHFLLEMRSWRIKFSSPTTCFCLWCSSVLFLSSFLTPQQAHFKELMALDLFFFSPFFSPPLPLSPLSTSLFPKRCRRCVRWVARCWWW